MNQTCPRCGATSVVGIEVRGVYDGVLFWSCDACRHRWHRWPKGSRLYIAAVMLGMDL